jgi:hypothetical protein
LLALVLGVVMLALVRLWQTGDQLPPSELPEVGVTLTDTESPTLSVVASDPAEPVVEVPEPVEEITPDVVPPPLDPVHEEPTAAPVEPVFEEPTPPDPATDPPETPEPLTDDPPDPIEDDPSAVVEMGALRLNAYPAARVYVDGEFVGTTLETAQGVELAAGEREVRLVRSSDGYEQTIHVVIRARKSLAVPFEWDDS